MNKTELTQHIADEIGLSFEQAQVAVNAIWATMETEILAGRPLRLKGFGTFSLGRRGHRLVKNQKNLTAYDVVDKLVIRFKPSPLLLAEINGIAPRARKG